MRPSFKEHESSQIPALQLLQNLGWTYLPPEEALSLRKGNIKNVILEDILQPQLKKINHFTHKGIAYPFKDSNILNAIHELTSVPFEGLISTSEKIFDLLTLGKSYVEEIKGDKKSYNLKYIDWNHPQNNTYHVTDEYNVETQMFDESKRRPDIVLFVNGIPLVVIECKRPDMKDPIEEAISQHIRNQSKKEIPHLFVFSQILMALCPTPLHQNKNRCLYATTGTIKHFWFPWQEQPYNNTLEEGREVDSRFRGNDDASGNDGVHGSDDTSQGKDLEKLVNTPLSSEQKEKLFGSERYRSSQEYFEKLEKSQRKITNQDIMLYGLCRPARLLEMIKKFILYDGGIKKIARYQQYFSIQDTLKRITSFVPVDSRFRGNDVLCENNVASYGSDDASRDDGVKSSSPPRRRRFRDVAFDKTREVDSRFRGNDDASRKDSVRGSGGAFQEKDEMKGQKRQGGVIWHTQGSGKSLSMVMLAKAIIHHPNIQNPKVVLVTDRVNLDAQIYKTFQNCQVNLVQAVSGTDLIKHLKSPAATVIATTIFKFDAASNTKGLTLKSKDIIVLVDEAHRTQYGQASAKVHKVFPNACFIAYTGTPLTKAEKHTMQKFGNFIGHPYTSRHALKDNATVRLFYEGRMAPQQINKNLLDRMFERITKDLTREQKADLKRKYRRSNQLAKTDQRIWMITLDVSQHFLRMWKGKGFKGQLVAGSIPVALQYKKYFDELGEVSTEVIVSRTDDRQNHTNPHEEESSLQQYERRIKENFGTHKKYEKDTIARFDSTGEPDILIVVSKLLTGFDVPRNTVLYIDKPIQDHTLLQAVARVNRPFANKNCGYVIDYHGNLKSLMHAIQHYDELAEENQQFNFDLLEREEIQNSIKHIKEVIDSLPTHYDNLVNLFSSVSNKQDLSAYEKPLFEKSKREDFYEKFSRFGNCLHQALSSGQFITDTPQAQKQKYQKELKFFCRLKNHIQKVYAESVEYRDYEPKIEKLLNNYVQAKEVRTVVPLSSIYDSQFAEDLKGQNKISQALMILHRVKKYATENREKDTAFYDLLSRLLQQVLDDYHQGRLNEKELLQQATRLKTKALTRTGDNLPPSLKSDVEKAFYGILKKVLEPKNKFNKKDVSRLADMSVHISGIVKENLVVDWVRSTDIQNRIKNKIEDYIDEQKEQLGWSIDFDAVDQIMEEMIKTAKVHHS